MRLAEVKEILEAQVWVGEDQMDVEIRGGAASDLMSDLLGDPKVGAVLLTGLNNIQVIRTLLIAGMAAVVIVRGKVPNADLLALAREHGVPTLSSPFTMYTSCGRLFSRGLMSIPWDGPR